jgi:hypothetical protein
VIFVASAWGDVATWIGAVGTVAAAWVAVVLYLQARREHRRAQARQISGWVPGGVSLIPAGMPIGASPLTAQQQMVSLLIAIRNSSSEIISDVKATPVGPDGADLGVSPTGWTDIGPGQTIEITHSEPDNGRARGEVRLNLQFTDAAGRRWERLGTSLKHLPSTGE